MVSRAEFASYIVDAYKRLYDLVYLRTHPLADILAPSPALIGKKRARHLHGILLDIIGELDPGPHAPAFSHEWRRHRLMVLRYVRGLNPQAVADQLAIGLRHYYRVHETTIEDVASLLWDRYVVHRSSPQEMSHVDQRDASAKRLELLRLEAARVAQADRYARVGDVIHGVLPLLDELLHQHKIAVDLSLSEPLPGVSMSRSLLRQMLLGMLGYLIEYTEQATLRLAAKAEGGAQVGLSLRVNPMEAVLSPSQAEVQEQLSAFGEMAALAGARLLPVLAGESVTGFDLQLPTAERTVLVVDDNEDILNLFRGYLSPHHYRVVTAQTAEDTVALARRLQPYAITLDLMLPDRDGWDLLQVLLNQPDTHHIPIIVCSVLRQKELALSLGASAFLEKPIAEETLLSSLEALEQM
jgi:CheY-like chemotaxis protein